MHASEMHMQNAAPEPCARIGGLVTSAGAEMPVPEAILFGTARGSRTSFLMTVRERSSDDS